MADQNRKKLIIASIMLVAVVIIVGISYAWLSITLTGQKTNVIKVGNLDLVLDETTSNGITIENGVAITDEEGLATDGSTFSLINNGDADICYELYLDDMDLERGETRVDDRFIKFSLDKGTTTGTPKVLTSIGTNPNRLLDSGTISSGETINFNLRMWFNSEEDGNYSGQVFRGKLRVEATQCEIKPVMRAYTMSSSSDYHNSAYRSKVTSIVTKADTLIPDTAIESWDVSEREDGGVIAYIEDDGSGSGTYKVTIGADGGVTANENSGYIFYNFANLTNIDLSYFDTSDAVILDGIFYNCTKLPTLDLSMLNTQNVISMQWLFWGDSNLTELNLDGIDTSQVTTMQSMFLGCSKLTTIDFSSFDTRKVTSFVNMFTDCSSLVSLDLNSFDFPSATTLYGMFMRCTNLASVTFGGDIDTSRVTTMASMFSDCRNLKELDLSSFDTSNVTTMGSMFSNCRNLKELDLSSFITPKVTDMYYMFNYCINLTTLDLSNFVVSADTSTFGMFFDCSALEFIDLKNAELNNSSGSHGSMFYSVDGPITIIVKNDAAKSYIEERLAEEYVKNATVTIYGA